MKNDQMTTEQAFSDALMQIGQQNSVAMHKQGPQETDLSKALGPLGRDVGLFDQYPVPNMPQNFMDPMHHVNANLNMDMQQYTPQSLGMNTSAQAQDDNQHVIMPFTTNEENDIIDDHLIDISSDTRYNYDQNDSRSGWNKQSKRNSSLKNRGTNMKGRMMLQTKNFMNMTMAQMVSDPGQYQGSKNLKFR